MEIVKDAIRVGNSAGVLVPINWLGSRVKVSLEPLNVEKDVLEILMEEKILKEVIGAYITGSYARGEQTIESDVDVLVITDHIDKKIVRGKYEIICISKDSLESQLKKNALPILAMLIEARTIINERLRKESINIKLNRENLGFHIETTKTAMNVVKTRMEIDKEERGKASDAIAYSLVLRLRTLYIVDCIRKGKIWSKREFLALVKKISGSTNIYERYEICKNKNTAGHEIDIEEAKKMMDYINNKMKEVERWAGRRK